MKNFLLKGLLLTVLAISTVDLFAQCISLGSRQVNEAFSVNVNGSHRTKWEIFEGSVRRDGSVSTLQRCNGEGIPFNSRERNANCVTFNFNNCNLAGRSFTILWNTYNWIGSNVGSGCFTVSITSPPNAVLQPVIAFNSLNPSCTQVTLCVANQFPTATYIWNTVPQTAGPCATYPVPTFPAPPTTVSVTAACGIGPSVVTTIQNSPSTFNPGIRIEGPFSGCVEQGIFLTAFSNTCVPSEANWSWSSSCGTISQLGSSTGNDNSIIFTPNFPGFCTVDLTVTDLFGNVITTSYFIEVLPFGDPSCFFFKGDVATTDLESEGAEVESRTDGSSVQQASLSLSPNPATDRMVINHTMGYNQLRVHDTNGQLLFQTVLPTDQDQYRLNTSTYSNGLYILTLSGPEKPVTTLKASIVR